MEYRVVGSSRVAGVDPGGTVELDPDRVNIPALIAGGHVEPVETPEAAGERSQRGQRSPAKAKTAEPGSDVT